MSERVFAYGSNMCRGRLLAHRVHPEGPGVRARLSGYALHFNKRSTADGSGKANVELHEGGTVWGVLYVIPDEDLAVLAAGEGGYTRTRLSVDPDAGPVAAWVYVANEPSHDAALRPYSWYKRFLVDGARSHGLPADYIAMLEAIAADDDTNQERDRQNRALACDEQSSMSDVMPLIVKQWKQSFKGISALEIGEILGISHDEAMARLHVLGRAGSVTLRPCQLGQGIKFHEYSMGEVTVKIPSEFEMVDTLMAFPNRQTLEDAFHKDRVDHGVFTNRLHLGDSQVHHYYFNRAVLDRYLRDREKYAVDDDATGGQVRMTSAYYQSLSDADQDTLGFATIRYGNMKLADGTEALGVIASDLGSLPKLEQHHWAAHEIASPVLSEDDKSWRDYISESFEGNWNADHTDYIGVLSATLDEVNDKVGELFRKTTHPGLHLPVLNTFGEYVHAHKELYKLVGADNLRQDGLKALLVAKGCGERDFVNDGGRPKGTWALLKLLSERLGLDWAAFDAVAENRHADSHKMESTSAGDEYYPARFREDVKKLIDELRKLL